jgi:hypothetical protein
LNLETKETTPYYFINDVEAMWQHCNTQMSPGTREICDAWVYFYQGHYESAVRSIVTGIEIALEHSIRKEKQSIGENNVIIEKYFKNRSNSFKKRFSDYVNLRKTYSPIEIPFAPIQSQCYDLKELLYELRELRHNIVHCGEIIQKREKKVIYKYLDMMMPLFLWISRDEKLPNFQHACRDFILANELTIFYCRQNNGKIEVTHQFMELDNDAEFEKSTGAYQLKRCLYQYIEGKEKNIKFFVLASMCCCTV